ncbi:DNA repair protein RAD51 homolog 2-like isoform X4 [Acanthaster planci]|uniref:DNA repair protein RAD51 homolog 2 n=1 Tax=Acanthaster planci TaxID=133434 RepID=A0A8B7Z3F0_ACAPL|nr:DNA repair protein RAD51 homolog 2-like isoform X4 [Acanthaster planci]
MIANTRINQWRSCARGFLLEHWWYLFTIMSSRKIQRLGIAPPVIERLHRHGVFSCQDLLSKTRLELLKMTGVTNSQLTNILLVASRACLPRQTTALSMYDAAGREECPAFFKTSLGQLDQVLHGGLPAGTISEIAGPPGCGKTQFCIMLSVLATLPAAMGGLDGAVAYIDTESAFSAERLVEVARCRFPVHFSCDEAYIALTSRIHVYQESTCCSLLARLQNLEEDLITKGIRLIVLDSVASLVRKEFDSSLRGNLIERTNLLSKQAAILKYLAEAFSIPVVVTNQITTRLRAQHSACQGSTDEAGTLDGGADSGVGGSYVMAALGNTWSHNVNTRLILQYLDETRREVLTAKSPIAPFISLVYTIQDRGIVLEGC